MRIGYARVSKSDGQDPAAQIASLKRARCKVIFTDEASGAAAERPELAKMLKRLKPGDEIIVWKVDRLSRSLVHLLWLLGAIDERGARFRSLTEAIDTSTPAGKMLLQLLGSFAEFERNMIRERTKHGLDQARRNGQKLGPHFKLTGDQLTAGKELLRTRTIAIVADTLGVSPATLKRALKRDRERATTGALMRAGNDGAKAEAG